MNASISRSNRKSAQRLRDLVTPEGVSLPVTVALAGSRFGAVLLDLILVGVVTFVLVLTLIFTIGGASLLNQGATEFLVVFLIICAFALRYGNFLYFELGPRAATPGKRLMGLRVAARDGGRLTPESVIARNLLRDIEIFLPLQMAFTSWETGLFGIAAFVWFLCFALFPFFNRDRLRAGDLIAGTWVIEAPKPKLQQAMSIDVAEKEYRFGDAELGIYGEHELQVLEGILRDNRPEVMEEVATTICGKIGWTPGHSDHRAFLETFYAQLRAKLERDMRFGKRKADKHS
ncbi:RDD family protein [Altericroceibacterium endophyticum]|uniref:RDD family protein n=1 Tax=Altericroceibacterium endophyticum TaxID=1808508 RepID=A0A6I4T1J6_9SPHN|nr:RDD family protein [Altericroceibacterium endophyticum]MXO65064.1 RDD family protein [Altericroceibacterium endophyticum]